MSKQKIVFFTGSMGRGGAERVISILSNYYCIKGWDVDICMLLQNINGYPLHKSIKVFDLSHKKQTNVVCRCFDILRKIRQYLNEEKPAIVVPFLAKINVLVSFAIIGFRKIEFKVIASERNDPYSVGYSWLVRRLVNSSYKRADAIVFQTKKAKSFYSKKIQDKSVIILNPTNIMIKRSNNIEPIIITAGRLEEQKNQRLLIEAFARISPKYPEYCLHIYGDGSLREHLTKQIEELNMTSKIILCGNDPDYLSKLAKCTLFVLPSNYEGLSNALIEAMSLGIPCISTNCAGSDEIIENGQNGLLTSVGNVDQMTNALNKLLSNRDEMKLIGEAAKQYSERFNLDNVISDWENVLEGKY